MTAAGTHRYQVVGVWEDGNPVVLSSHSTLRAALDEATVQRQFRIPTVGVNDSADYERGWLDEDDA